WASVPLLAALSWGSYATVARVQLGRRVDVRLADARAALAEANTRNRGVELLRARAFARFDAGDTDAGEALWAEVLRAAEDADAEFARATRTLEEAALLDPKRADARGVLSDVAAERAI